jgi:hypothetical protein
MLLPDFDPPLFDPLVVEWFTGKFGEPTGSGKTPAAHVKPQRIGLSAYVCGGRRGRCGMGWGGSDRIILPGARISTVSLNGSTVAASLSTNA